MESSRSDTPSPGVCVSPTRPSRARVWTQGRSHGCGGVVIDGGQDRCRRFVKVGLHRGSAQERFPQAGRSGVSVRCDWQALGCNGVRCVVSLVSRISFLGSLQKMGGALSLPSCAVGRARTDAARPYMAQRMKQWGDPWRPVEQATRMAWNRSWDVATVPRIRSHAPLVPGVERTTAGPGWASDGRRGSARAPFREPTC